MPKPKLADRGGTFRFERSSAIVGRPLEQRLRALLRAVIDAHLVEPDLHRTLVEVAPRLGPIQGRAETLANVEAVVAELLSARGASVGDSTPSAMAAVLLRTVDATVHRLLFRADPADADAIEVEPAKRVGAWLGIRLDRRASGDGCARNATALAPRGVTS